MGYNEQFGTEMSTNKNKGITGKVLITGIVAVLLIVGIASAGYVVYSTVSERELSPEEMVLTAYSNLVNAGSFSFTVSGSVKDPEQGTEFNYEVPGSVNIEDPLERSSIRLMPTVSGSIELQPGSPANFNVSGEIRFIDEVVYLSIDEMPMMLSMFIPLQSGEWIYLEPEETLDDELDEDVDIEYFKEEMLRLLQEKPPYTLHELPEEEVGGDEMYVYSVELDQEKLREFNEEALVIAEEAGINVSDEREQEIVEEMEEWSDSTADTETVIMIRQDDRTLHSIESSVEFTEGKMAGTVSEVEISFSGIGEEVTINAPEGARSFEELFQSAFDSMEFDMEAQ